MQSHIFIFSLFLCSLMACTKEEVISSTTRQGRILGYGSTNFVDNGAMNWGVIDFNTGLAQYSGSLPNMSSVYNQAMYTPDGKYHIPTPFNQIATNTQSYIKRIHTTTLQIDSIDALSSNAYTTCLTYSPVTQKSYAIQADTMFSYTVDETGTPKKVVKNTRYPGLGLGTHDYSFNSTAHAKQPFIYIASFGKIRQLDLNSGNYTTIIDSTGNFRYYGIRYNLFDDKVYVIAEKNNAAGVVLQRINGNVLETVATFPFTSFNSDLYTATIHCCENKYILFMDKFYNVDIPTGVVTEVASTEKYQGLIWINK